MTLDLAKNFTHLSDEYIKFATEKDLCRKCELYNCYEQVIQSEGNGNNPTFMFVGECGGKDEVHQNRPFIGRAGQRLREELRKHTTFHKDNTLISNVLGCRPQDNKFPKEESIWKNCYHLWLEREILLLQPKVIVVLGNPALAAVREQQGITFNRGTWSFLSRFRAWSFATFHPSYVIRQKKGSLVEDQFIDDIKKVAVEWGVVLESSGVMHMTSVEWKQYKKNQTLIKLGLKK